VGIGKKKMRKSDFKKVLIGLAAVSVMSVTPTGYNSLQAQETTGFTADTAKAVALSSGWEEDDFTATVSLSGKGNYAKGTWKLTVKPPSTRTVSGLNDSYVQTAFGICLLRMDLDIAMSWLLRAALQDEMDAIMFLAVNYATTQEVKNASEAERWFRKAVELGNPDAQTNLDNLLAGKDIDTSIKLSNGYNFSFSLAESEKK
jgi:hypothetical protein